MFARQQTLFKEYLSQSADCASNKLPEAKRLVSVCLIMIFIVHATITEEVASAKSKGLTEIFDAYLPSCALRQMSEFLKLITDRII